MFKGCVVFSCVCVFNLLIVFNSVTMASGEKKISFGFSKSVKKPTVYKNTPPKETKHELIECLDAKTIKVVGGVENKNEPQVIPMRGSTTWHERILNKVNADIFESKTKPTSNGNLKNVNIKQEVTEDDYGVTRVAAVTLNNDPQPMEVVTIKQEVLEKPATTLEEQAAQEILRDLQSQGEKTEETNIPVVPLPEDESLVGKQESTLEDYEQVPIQKYGEAMLRGMGWQPGKGIGKNEKVVQTVIPELRPRGMGLGAKKLMIQKQIADSKSAGNKDLKIIKDAFVKIIVGKWAGNYGQIAGLDDECGRLMIKLTIGGEIISVSESLVQPVSKDEYNENAKVLNSKKYNAYKNNVEKKTSTSVENLSDSDSERKSRRKRNSSESDEDYKRKKSKKNKQYSSQDDSDSERRSKKRRNSSDTDEDHKRKKSKKTKKSKKRDSSSERTRHRNKRKNKGRERESRDSPKRNKYRPKRSRSRSPRRR